MRAACRRSALGADALLPTCALSRTRPAPERDSARSGSRLRKSAHRAPYGELNPPADRDDELRGLLHQNEKLHPSSLHPPTLLALSALDAANRQAEAPRRNRLSASRPTRRCLPASLNITAHTNSSQPLPARPRRVGRSRATAPHGMWDPLPGPRLNVTPEASATR